MLTYDPIYSVKQIRDIESRAINHHHISESKLMESAGYVAFQQLRNLWPSAERIAIFCGSGNNGGDGYIVAVLAAKAGLTPHIFATHPPGTTVSREAETKARSLGIRIDNPSLFSPQKTDVIVDAVLGIGIQGEVREEALKAIEIINKSQRPILSIDIPSGLDGDTGEPMGASVIANATTTLIGLKQGFYQKSGLLHTGLISVSNLSIPHSAFQENATSFYRIDAKPPMQYLQQRRRDSHKGDYGHLLIIGGDKGYSGAPLLAAEGALRTGIGLATIATHPLHAPTLNLSRPEIMVHAIEKGKDLEPLLDKASHIIIGPGMIKSRWSKMCFDAAIKSKKPMIIDAGAFHYLKKNKNRKTHWILTPHPGEAARLLQRKKIDNNNRTKILEQLLEQFKCTTVLKGMGTLVGSPADKTTVCDRGNPGMASGGMGDLLCGIIAGLYCQGLSPRMSAELGAYIHAFAGDLCAQQTGIRGMLASDLLPFIKKLANEV